MIWRKQRVTCPISEKERIREKLNLFDIYFAPKQLIDKYVYCTIANMMVKG